MATDLFDSVSNKICPMTSSITLSSAFLMTSLRSPMTSSTQMLMISAQIFDDWSPDVDYFSSDVDDLGDEA